MHPVVLAWLTRLLWTPKPTRQVAGLPRSLAERIEPSLDALAPHTPPELAEEILEDARAILREGLAERAVPDGVYQLELNADFPPVARIVRASDNRSWSLREFDDFIDLGLHPTGSDSRTDGAA